MVNVGLVVKAQDLIQLTASIIIIAYHIILAFYILLAYHIYCTIHIIITSYTDYTILLFIVYHRF